MPHSVRRLALRLFLCACSLASLRAVDDLLAPPGTESHVYRELTPTPLRLYIFKPDGWKAGDHRPAMVWFFGGGGKPTSAAAWASWAAKQGMIGVAPDYREKGRYNSTRADVIADARAVVRWLQDHADELGLDPKRIIAGGNSAGGRLALWTAIGHVPPGSTAAESPLYKPVALILTSTSTDNAGLNEPNALALSPIDQLDARMPPVLMFHGDADEGTSYAKAAALHDKLAATGNTCEFITIPRGSHNYAALPGWWPRTLEIAQWFLGDLQLISKS